eukprot:GHUV01057627.1.p1 GENE.GHUV01057627.1~~GHUV01057627.1.p1  ORF type:complete len:242 (+),score=39.13 GHUV01057627.1:1464-2189(+)
MPRDKGLMRYLTSSCSCADQCATLQCTLSTVDCCCCCCTLDQFAASVCERPTSEMVGVPVCKCLPSVVGRSAGFPSQLPMLMHLQIGYGADKMKLTSKRILAAYFIPNPQLFMDIFGFPLAELHPDGLLSVRPWHDETIAVMAPHKNPGTHKMLVNAIMRESLAQEHKNKLTWHGNCLMLSSSLQSDLHRDLGGVTRYAVTSALQDKLKARGVTDEVEAKWKHGGKSESPHTFCCCVLWRR